MSERSYRFGLGALLLFSLYFDLAWMMYGLAGLFLLEGVTNVWLVELSQTLRGSHHSHIEPDDVSTRPEAMIAFEAGRLVWLTIGTVLLISYQLPTTLMWFAPWLIGFILLGSAVCGVCPMTISMRWMGFR